jgi:hypothetical protein
MRAGPLSNEKIIALLNAYFVPVYLSNEDYAKDGSASPGRESVSHAIFCTRLRINSRTG